MFLSTMNIFSKIILAITVAAIAAWLFPWCYAFITAKADSSPFVLYSSLLGDYIITQRKDDSVSRHDTAGNIFNENEVDSLLPAMYMRQLVADGRFPDSILGKHVEPQQIQMTNFTFRSSPRDINYVNAGIYFLFESLPKRVDLEMPDDAFRFNDKGIQFFNMADNSINETKSDMFTTMLKEKGFVFPPRKTATNPDPRKEYDNGALLIDASGQLFNMKCTAGRPYVKHIALPDGVIPCEVYVTEFRDKAFLGFFSSTDKKFYVIMNDGSIRETGIKRFDPYTESAMIIGNMFDWTVKITRTDTYDYYALRADNFSLIKELKINHHGNSIPGLSFTSLLDKYVIPHFRH